MKTRLLAIGTQVFFDSTVNSSNNSFAFFGNRTADLPAIKAQFPKITFTRLKQIHSAQICESLPNQDLVHSADAHFSLQKNHGLCVITADCAPILIFSSQEKVVAAIHAGWRGVASRILPKTLDRLKMLGLDFNNVKIMVGPHIQLDSFEVDFAAKKQILDSIQMPLPQKHFFDISEQKSKVDLHEVIKSQIFEYPLATDNLFFLNEDTKTNLAYHSYRRDKETSGRQISFLVMKD